MLYIRRGQNPNHIIHVVYQEGTNTQTYNTYYQMGEMGLYQKEGNTQPHYTSCISGGARTATLYNIHVVYQEHLTILHMLYIYTQPYHTCSISGGGKDPTISYMLYIKMGQIPMQI